MRYCITLSYNGTAYHGWQRQPNGNSIQETLEEAMSTLLRQEISITGAGRTDAGVHAKKMVAHFDYQTPLPEVDAPASTPEKEVPSSPSQEPSLDTESLVRKLNSFLPPDIAIFNIKPVAADFHARFDAVSRSYEYHVHTQKDVFSKGYSLYVPADTDFTAMNQAAQLLFQYTDFTSFSKLHTDVKTNNCTITRAQWVQVDATHWIFHITANRFLRNMVRAIVGTLLWVGNHKITLQEFAQIIEQKNRCDAGSSVPGEALYLANVTYPTH